MKKAGFSALEKPAFHLCVRVVLEVVNQAKFEIIGAEVKAKALFAVNRRNLFIDIINTGDIVIVTIAQEAHRGNEVNLLAQANLYAWLDTNLPHIVRVALPVTFLSLGCCKAEAAIKEE